MWVAPDTSVHVQEASYDVQYLEHKESLDHDTIIDNEVGADTKLSKPVAIWFIILNHHTIHLKVNLEEIWNECESSE